VQNIASGAFGGIAENLAVIIPILIVLIAAVVVYLVLMVRAIIDMLRYDVHAVLLTFAFLALIPFPLILIMGITILIIWHYHKRDIVAGKRQTR
jgi:predicted transporter